MALERAGCAKRLDHRILAADSAIRTDNSRASRRQFSWARGPCSVIMETSA